MQHNDEPRLLRERTMPNGGTSYRYLPVCQCGDDGYIGEAGGCCHSCKGAIPTREEQRRLDMRSEHAERRHDEIRMDVV